MKTIFTVNTSYDGLSNVVFTNIKALYNYITNSMNVTNASITKASNRKKVQFNYNSMVSEIRDNQKTNSFYVCWIELPSGEEITINELGIITK